VTATFFRPDNLYPTYGYSHAVSIEGPGKFLLLSGQVAFDVRGAVLAEGGFSAQARLVFDNVASALAAAGATFGEVIKLVYYVVDLRAEHRPILASIRDEYISTQNPPASVLLGVSALALPDLLIEIEATAFVPGS
jgi:enamine deaminase RidA (YjgF/YER057c/UK114 family)